MSGIVLCHCTVCVSVCVRRKQVDSSVVKWFQVNALSVVL